MKRMLALLAVPALAVSLVAPAQAALPGADAKVKAKDLVSAAQVAKVLGVAKVDVKKTKVKQGYAIKSCKKSSTFKLKSGLSGSYMPNPMTGATTGDIAVWETKNAATAKKVLKGYKVGAKCGTMKSEFGTVTVSKLKTPKAGKGSAGYKIDVEGFTLGSMVAIKKNKVVIVNLTVDGKADAAKNGKLLKKAIKKA